MVHQAGSQPLLHEIAREMKAHWGTISQKLINTLSAWGMGQVSRLLRRHLAPCRMGLECERHGLLSLVRDTTSVARGSMTDGLLRLYSSGTRSGDSYSAFRGAKAWELSGRSEKARVSTRVPACGRKGP